MSNFTNTLKLESQIGIYLVSHTLLLLLQYKIPVELIFVASFIVIS